MQGKQLPSSPVMQIVAGKPAKAVCIAPSQATTGKPFSIFLRIEDRWGNSIGKAREYEQKAPLEEKIQTICITDVETGLSAESNPIRVIEEKPEILQYWADFHGQSEETIGSNSIEDYFLYARDCAKLDIAAYQGNDFQITDAFWNKTNNTTKKCMSLASLSTGKIDRILQLLLSISDNEDVGTIFGLIQKEVKI